jgi:hypothetical protein
LKKFGKKKEKKHKNAPHAVQEDAVLKKISQLGFTKIPEAREIDPKKLHLGQNHTEQLFFLVPMLQRSFLENDYLIN